MGFISYRLIKPIIDITDTAFKQIKIDIRVENNLQNLSLNDTPRIRGGHKSFDSLRRKFTSECKAVRLF